MAQNPKKSLLAKPPPVTIKLSPDSDLTPAEKELLVMEVTAEIRSIYARYGIFGCRSKTTLTCKKLTGKITQRIEAADRTHPGNTTIRITFRDENNKQAFIMYLPNWNYIPDGSKKRVDGGGLLGRSCLMPPKR